MALRIASLLAVAAAAAALPAQPKQDRAAKVRADKKGVEAAGAWIYDDLPRGIAEAKRTERPLLVVFRCIPCQACAKLDEDVVARDAKVRDLLDRYVCVRIPHANGVDLSLFQLDWDQSWAAFLLNADLTIYGRYGTRSHRTRSEDDVSLEGFAQALEKGLELHARWPKDRAALASKRGAPLQALVAEELPGLAGRYGAQLDWDGKVVQSCIHCHQIGEALRAPLRAAGKPIPDALLFPHPHPKALGLWMDPKAAARVLRVDPGSAAAKSGFAAGDEIARLDGQPVLSTADLQWVLHGAGETASLEVEVVRGGEPGRLVLALDAGWRQKADISWRATSWDLRRMVTGGLVLEDLSDVERTEAGLEAGALALRVEHVGQYGEHATAKQAGFQKDDVLVAVGERKERATETELLARLLRETKPGDVVAVRVLRKGRQVELKLPMR